MIDLCDQLLHGVCALVVTESITLDDAVVLFHLVVIEGGVAETGTTAMSGRLVCVRRLGLGAAVLVRCGRVGVGAVPDICQTEARVEPIEQ